MRNYWLTWSRRKTSRKFERVAKNAFVLLDGVTVRHAGNMVAYRTRFADAMDALGGNLGDFLRVLEIMRKEILQ